MAATIIATTVTEKLTSMLADTILEDLKLVTGFREDFEFLCQQAGSVQCLLNEMSDTMNSRSISRWMEKLEDFVEDAIDILEECREECRVAGNQRFRNLFFRFSMGRKIKKLKERLDKLHGDAKYLKYITFASILNVNDRVLNTSEDQRERSTSLIKESETVGMEENTKIIEIESTLNEEGHRVVAIVGMGGQGKTLLAQHLYQRLRSGFDHRVWLPVSQKYIAHTLLKDVAKSVKLEKGDQMSQTDLEEKIKERFKEKRLLIVLDDVWNIQVIDDIGLRVWLNECKSMKVIVTTRDRSIADGMKNLFIHKQPKVYHMEALTEDASFKLFCIHAFPDLKEQSSQSKLSNKDTEQQTPPSNLATSDLRKKISPPKLVAIADCIVKRCAGLPLAIKTVGSYMATVRRLPNDWQRALDHLNEAAPVSDKVMPSLKLSYDALPNHLKICFAYCSVFPKNISVQSEYLVYAWIAQEFISTQVPSEETYFLGMSYINQFIDRCLMEASDVGVDGRVETWKMHDLLHDLALSESLKQTKCFLKPAENYQNIPVEKCRGSRRISLMQNDISAIEENLQCPGLRTLLLYYNKIKSISASVFNDLKYLTMLDVSATSITSLPESIGNLKHLKFLDLAETKIEILPESLSGLKRLLYLDVSYCFSLRRLHSGIGDHQFMLHLNTEHSSNIELFPIGISQLTSLITLKCVTFKTREIRGSNANVLTLQDAKGLGRLQHLSLKIATVTSSSNGIQVEEGIVRLDKGIFGEMTKMRVLIIDNDDETKFLDLPEDIENMQDLEILHLYKCVMPKAIFELQNLVEVKLTAVRDYKGLETISSLRKIVLWSDRRCVRFPEEFENSNAFPNLEWFEINQFEGLEKFPSLRNGAMPKLKHLEFWKCNRLKNMPEGIEKLQSLETVVVWIKMNDRQEIEDVEKCLQILKSRQIKVQQRIEGPSD